MTTISAVLTAINAKLAAVNPAPAPALTASYVYPDDEPIMFRADDLPVLVTQRNPQIDHVIRRQTDSTYIRQWQAVARIFMAETSMPDEKAEALYQYWEGDIETALLSDPQLNGTVETFGVINEGGSFTIGLGHAPHYHTDTNKPKAYWTIEVQLRVVTKHTMTEDYTAV